MKKSAQAAVSASGNVRSEIYNRIEGYFQEVKGGTLIIKNIQLLTFET